MAMKKQTGKGEETVKEKRRGKGEGTIYQRPDGSWCAIVNHGVVDGKRRRTSLYGKTRKEVVAKLRKLQLETHQGLVADGPKQTVAQYLEAWLTQVVTVRNKPRTLRSYQDMVRLHLSPHLGRHSLDKLATSHVQVMLNKLPDAKLSPRSVQYAKGVLCRALNVAVKWGLVPRNVATHAEAPSGSSRAITPLSEAQARKLLDAVKGHRLEALYRIALSLGLRRGEVVGLLWEDVDLDAATLRISGALQRVNGKLVRTTPKTAASAATLPLPEVLVRLLRQHKERQELERQNTKDWQEHGYVFPSERGTPLEPRNLNRHFKAALKRAGLPATIRVHDLRHSCATLLIAQGVHPRVVMEILRHSQISVTMNTYAHVIPDQQRDATAKIAGLFAELAPEQPEEVVR
jgi:integrase